MMEVEEAAIAMLVELKRLRVEGVREIFLSDQSLEGLKEALGSKNAQNSHDRSPEKEQVRSNKTLKIPYSLAQLTDNLMPGMFLPIS